MRRFASRLSRLSLACALALVPGTRAAAQVAPLTVPDPSPRASATQRVGITDVTVTFHRPAVNKRKIWGGLVPYGQPWRAGANENTVVTFSSPVTVGGKHLDAGSYGFHAIPTEKDWTIAFSKQSHAWGSFTYDPKEDALRVTVTPQPAEFQERMGFTFDDPTNDGVTLALRWEKLRVPVEIKVDTPAVVVESLREELRGLPRFSWQGWNQAAAYCLAHGVNLDEAMTWADESIKLNRNFANQRTKAGLLEKKGDAKGAAELRAAAMKVATENEVNLAGYQLLGQGKTDEAIELFRKNAKDHPDSWNVHDSLGEALAKKGNVAEARASYEKALSITTDEAQKKRIREVLGSMK